jgi:hypothetical protein
MMSLTEIATMMTVIAIKVGVEGRRFEPYFGSRTGLSTKGLKFGKF